MTAKTTQLERVATALLAGDPVDQVEANRRGWGLRLGALIYRLRGRGWPVHTERDHNNGLARYSVPEGERPATGERPARQAKPLADAESYKGLAENNPHSDRVTVYPERIAS